MNTTMLAATKTTQPLCVVTLTYSPILRHPVMAWAPRPHRRRNCVELEINRANPTSSPAPVNIPTMHSRRSAPKEITVADHGLAIP
jgi:hypothetical protein